MDKEITHFNGDQMMIGLVLTVRTVLDMTMLDYTFFHFIMEYIE